jgi:hypothetical protein
MARTALKKQLADKKASALQVLTFKTRPQDFMQAVVQKLLDKSPIRYGLGRNPRWLVPKVIIKKDWKEADKTQ